MAENRYNVKSPQPLPRVLGLRIDGSAVSASSAGTAGLDEGSNDATIIRATNTFTITFDTAFSAAPVIACCPITAAADARISAVSASACTITVDTAANVTDLHLIIMGHDSATRYG